MVYCLSMAMSLHLGLNSLVVSAGRRSVVGQSRYGGRAHPLRHFQRREGPCWKGGVAFCADSSNSSQEPQKNSPAPQDAVLQAISDLSRAEGRVPLTTNMVMGGTRALTADQIALDEKVNVYPQERPFTIIGTGGDDFVQSVVGTLESVLSTNLPEGSVSQRLSAKGKYVSVHIGPVLVDSSDQVRALYEAMRRDSRMKYFI